jgi:hypothetical protein
MAHRFVVVGVTHDIKLANCLGLVACDVSGVVRWSGTQQRSVCNMVAKAS